MIKILFLTLFLTGCAPMQVNKCPRTCPPKQDFSEIKAEEKTEVLKAREKRIETLRAMFCKTI